MSGVAFFYTLYTIYTRAKHLRFVKNTISLLDEEIEDLLVQKEEKKVGFFTKIDSLLKHTGAPFSSLVFSIIFIAFVLLSGSLFSLFLRHWSGYLIGIPFGAMIFALIISTIITNRQKKFNQALAIAIAVLVKMMKNGIGFEQALTKSIAVSNSTLFKEIFERFFKEKHAIGEVAAFANMHQYINSKELRIFALAIKIGRESGGQFSNTLEKVEQTISYREKMQRKIDVVTREGTFGSYVVVGITIFLYFMLNSNFNGKLHEYFMTSPWGRFELLGISLWVFVGIMLNKYITRVAR